MPRHVTLVLARVAGSLAFWLDWRGRTTALENLRCVFGGEKSEGELRRITRQCYQGFARTFMDLFWTASLTDENYSQHIRLRFADDKMEEEASGSGAIWITPHFGNFELSGMVWGFRGFKKIIVAQDFKNPALTPIFTRLRMVSGHQVIPSKSAMLRLMKAMRGKGYTGILTDLTVKPGRAAAVIECFGRKTCVTVLHVMLAQKFGIGIHPVLCYPMPDGTYEIHVANAIRPGREESMQKVAQRCWDQFEPHIRERPELWMWMYKHWRYLPGAERDPAYPAYANPSKAFAALVSAAKEQGK